MKCLHSRDELAVFLCDCGCKFETENLWYNGERLLAKCPNCGEINIDATEPPLWEKVATFPLQLVLIGLHFTACSFLTIFVHPAPKRYKYYKYYEYYAPWGWGGWGGWGARKDCPYDGDDGDED